MLVSTSSTYSVPAFGDGCLDPFGRRRAALELDRRRELDRSAHRGRQHALLEENDRLLRHRAVIALRALAQPLMQLVGQVLDDQGGHPAPPRWKQMGSEMVTPSGDSGGRLVFAKHRR